MKYKLKMMLWVSPVIVLLDQLTKWLIVQKVPIGSRIEVIKNFFDIVHTRNTGAAFGIFAASPSQFREPFFYIISLVAIFFLFYFLKELPPKNKQSPIAIALIFGGAIGNILDRIFRGSVVDFLFFHWYNRVADWSLFGYPLRFELAWPAFNVADSAITVGVMYLLYSMAAFERQGANK